MEPNNRENTDRLSAISRSSNIHRSIKRYLRSKRHGDRPLANLRDQIRNSRLFHKARSNLPDWLQPFQKYDVDESFVPCPKITFLVDKPRPMLCQICRDSHFKLRCGTKPLADETFAILPCGHVAGSLCLTEWCEQHHECPFCRFKLKYPSCCHNIEPRMLTTTGIHLIPRTLPDNGEIPPKCDDCFKRDLLKAAHGNLSVSVKDFETKRRRAYFSGKRDDEKELQSAKEELESVMRKEVYEAHLVHWLNSW